MDSTKLREVFEATLTVKDKRLHTALRIPPLDSFLGKEYANEYTQRREATGIHLRSLRFSEEIVTEETKLFKETRYSDHERPEHSLVIWHNNVVHMSDDLEVVEWSTDPEAYKETLDWFEKEWEAAVSK